MADTDNGEHMWCLLMFDLPVISKKQRREATLFRNDLLDAGFFMVQLSVYAKHARYATEYSKVVRYVKYKLPPGGEVRLVMLSDIQWAKMFRFSDRIAVPAEERPSQLTIF